MGPFPSVITCCKLYPQRIARSMGENKRAAPEGAARHDRFEQYARGRNPYALMYT